MTENPCFGCDKRHDGCRKNCPRLPLPVERHYAKGSTATSDYVYDKAVRIQRRAMRKRTRRGKL